MVLSLFMTMQEYIKRPRLYVDEELASGAIITLDKAQQHYLGNVMRLNTDDTIRLFNGRDGEWLGVISTMDKKNGSVRIENNLRSQSGRAKEICLVFALIKKARMDFLIEKAVELGVTSLQPVITDHTDIRKINTDRIQARIIEAAEQCERIDIPALSTLQTLPEWIDQWNKGPVYACTERVDSPHLTDIIDKNKDVAILIGPEGGFSPAEKDTFANQDKIRSVSLGEPILRSETAAIVALAHTQTI